MNNTPAAETEAKQPRSRKGLWILLGGAALLLLAAGLVLPALLDVESYRGRIEEGLQSATGWQTELGEMDFSVLQGMVLTVSPAHLSAPGDGSRFDISRIEVKAELWPLLRGQLNIRRFELVGPEITLVRASEEQGWILPFPAAQETSSEERPAPSGIDVAIDRVEVRDGTLLLDDRAGDPPLRLELRDLQLSFAPEAGRVSGQAEVAEDAGRLAWSGSLDEGLELELDDLRTELLHPWVGPDLVHEGGRLDGVVGVSFPLAIEGRLEGDGLTLLAGEQPFESAEVEFRIVTEGERWLLDKLEFDGGGAKLSGSGSLVPTVDLELELPRTPLDVTLAAAKSVLPLPLDLEPPGSVEARLFVDQPPGGELTYEAHGTLQAAAFRPSEMLPAARDVQAAFDLDREGRLEVRVLDGRVGEGPLAGTARLSSVTPPGKLVFDGGIRDAVLGQLLAGFVDDAGGRVTGPTGLTADVGLDLSREIIDARALSGRLELASREVQLPGWDLEGAIRRKVREKLGALSALAGEQVSEESGDAAAAVDQLFDSLEARVDFDSWPWKLERLAMGAGGLSTSGEGTFDPVAGSVDLRFTARLDPAKTAELVEKSSQLRLLVDGQGRLAVPLEVEGPLLSPSIDVDLGQALSQKLDAEETVKGLIKGLLDRKKKKKDGS